MNISAVNNEGQVTLVFDGRLDTFTTEHLGEQIDQHLSEFDDISSLACDFAKVTYISSSGLRIMLTLAKRFSDFSIINVMPAVYQVFDVTGFTKIMTIERALRKVSIEGCNIIGRGGVGVVYRISDDTIIKVFLEGTTFEQVKREILMAKEAFVLGMPTAISFDIVEVGTQYGLQYELLNSDTLSAIVSNDPANIDKYAHMYADLFRQLHSIEVPPMSIIPNALESEENAVRHITRYFDTKSVDILLSIIENVPHACRLLHCDLQSKNAMIQNGDPMLIDMGEMGYGHPIIDLAHGNSAMADLIGDYDGTIGMPRELGNDLWRRTLDYYFEGLSAADKAHRIEQIQVMARVRNFCWLSLSDGFPPEVIRSCQEVFHERVTKQRDRILSISKTFNDWEL